MKKKIVKTKKSKKNASKPKRLKKPARNASGISDAGGAKKSANKKMTKKAFWDAGKIKKDLRMLIDDLREAKNALFENVSQVFNFGIMTPHQAKVVVLVAGIIFIGLLAVAQEYEYSRLFKTAPIQTSDTTNVEKDLLEKKITNLVKGSPIEEMVPYIIEKDQETAAYLVGIAKKESNWGKRKPVLNGEDCYNYWGFRLEREKMGSGGHTCFDSPKDAVDTVASRIEQIIENNDVQSAKQMVVWKCGYSCETHSNESVKKWISDVDYYAGKVLN